MTLDEVRKEVAEILSRNATDGDANAVFSRQHDLVIAVLKAVVAGEHDAVAMAAEVLRIDDGGRGSLYA